MVNLGARSYLCNLWGLAGIPCEHALACISSNHLKAEDFVHPYFLDQNWIKTYEPYIEPIVGQRYWKKTGKPEILPPHFKRPAGHSKKQQRKDNDVPTNPYKIKKQYGNIACAKCGELGHNARTCKGAPVKKSNTTSAPSVEVYRHLQF